MVKGQLLPVSNSSPSSSPSSSASSSPSRRLLSSKSSAIPRTNRRVRVLCLLALVCSIISLPFLYSSILSPSFKRHIQPYLPKRLDRAPVFEAAPFETSIARLSAQNKTVIFIGDASIRYQYLALVYYIETGKTPVVGDPVTLVDGRHDPTNNHTWDDWNQFFDGTSRVREADRSHSCDCRWDGKAAEPDWENRRYRDPRMGLNLAYFSMSREDGVCSLKGASFSRDQATPDWCASLGSFVEAQLNIDSSAVIVLGAGLEVPLAQTSIDRVAAVVRSHPSSKFIFRTTTPRRSGGPSTPDPTTASDVGRLDTVQLLKRIEKETTVSMADLYWPAVVVRKVDGSNYTRPASETHFQAHVQQTFNQALVEML
ncbi:hypothetical protein HKX48_002445 [Thoreauomyces humboldtii]|nr:hypothetical protein HKX48_002445 [Thoreauomyces humboldtii]